MSSRCADRPPEGREAPHYQDQGPASYVVIDSPCRLAKGTVILKMTVPRATADVFTKGHLTISSADTGDEMETYVPRRWKAARVYDAFDQLAYELMNPEYAE